MIYGQCWSIHFPLFFLSLFFYCYSVKVAPIFLPLPSSAQPIPHSHSQSPHCCPCLWVIHTSSLTSLFPFFPPLSPPPSPLASVSLFHVSVDQKNCGTFTQQNTTQQKEKRSIHFQLTQIRPIYIVTAKEFGRTYLQVIIEFPENSEFYLGINTLRKG